MATPLGGERSNAREEARALALAVELGAQLGRLKGAGPKIRQFLSMVRLDRAAEGERSLPALGALPDGARAVPFGRARRVLEQDLDARVGELFADVDEQPFALASLGQVHRARTSDGDDVAVKLQHPGVAEAVEGDLRDLGLVAPLVKRLAPGLDAGAVLSEIRERISDELDYELEAQHQRRLGRLFRGHPHVRLPRVRTDLSTRRVLVTEYVDGLRADEIKRLDDAERDRIGEIAFRFFFSLVWRHGAVAGDPHPDNCILCPDGRACSTSACCATSTRTTSRANATSCGRSPTRTRGASTTACRASATCVSPKRSIATRCSSTSRRRASGCSPTATAASTPHTSPRSWSSATRRARRISR
jgi:predicted unusual protein kinase regulating ubiquinone biosynthesis (AarF/ABC1/UbiB family)